MRVLQEITEWRDNTLNNTYFVSDDRSKMYAYVRSGTNTVVTLSKAYGFEVRGRRFIEIENHWGWQPAATAASSTRSWTVAGSAGNSYTVTEHNGKLACNCSGFKYRGRCRHLEVVDNQEVL